MAEFTVFNTRMCRKVSKRSEI